MSPSEPVAAVTTGRLRPAGPTERMPAAIAATGPHVHAYTAVTADEARARAAEPERAGRRGPLHGVPVGVEDLIDTAGVRAADRRDDRRGRRARMAGRAAADPARLPVRRRRAPRRPGAGGPAGPGASAWPERSAAAAAARCSSRCSA